MMEEKQKVFSEFINEFVKLDTSQKNDEIVELDFDRIRKTLGFEIDHSFLKYKKELEDYGYVVKKIYLKDKKVMLKKYK